MATAWGTSHRSCESLLERLERNDPALRELTVLPTKAFGDAEVERLATLLERGTNPHWRRLSASGHAVSAAALRRLGRAIGQQKVVTELAIGNSATGNEGVTALCEGLAESTEIPLTDLDLSYKGFGRSALMKILETLGKSQRLVRLDLSRNPFICTCRLRLGEELTGNECYFTKLCHLDLSDCNLDDEFVHDLRCIQPDGEFTLRLNNNTNITRFPMRDDQLAELALSGCQIDDRAMEELLASKPNCLAKLRELDLSKNSISCAGAEALALLLYDPKTGDSGLPSLRGLNLDGNKLGDEGVSAIVSSLKSRNMILDSLDLSDTACGSDGAADAVRNCPSRSLRLTQNGLGSQGFLALAPSMAHANANMRSLDLACNEASGAAVIGLLSILRDSSSALQTLIIGGNENNAEVEGTIALLKASNPQLDVARDKLKKSHDT